MGMVRKRWLGLAVAAGVLLAAGPAAAEDPQTVRLQFDGSAEVDAVQEAGIELDHGATRVPNGIEIEAHLTQSELLRAIAAGAEVLEPGEEFQWTFEAAQAPLAGPGAAAAGRADGADRARRLLHDQGSGLPLRRGANHPEHRPDGRHDARARHGRRHAVHARPR